MKNRLNILFGLLAVVMFSASCDDFFDIDLKNGVEDKEFYTNSNDLNAAAYGIYAALAPDVHKFLLWGSARADMVANGSENDAFVTEFANNSISSINPYTNYAFLYKAIARCNQQLARLYRVKPDVNSSKDYLDGFYGEAYFVRALCYFWLVRTYKEFPVIEEDISAGITHVSSQGDTIRSRTLSLSNEDIRNLALQPANEQKVWALIQSDLKNAMKMLRTDPQWLLDGYGMPEALKKIRASQAATHTLAAEVAIWMGQYEKALGYAGVAQSLTLGNESTWSNQFTGTIENSGTYPLFSIAYYYTYAFETNRLQEFTSNIESDGGKYLLMPVMSVYNEIFDETEDCRRVSAMRINRQPVIWKYIGTDTEGKTMREPYESDAAFHLIKAADAYLWQGIAACRTKNYDMAFTNLNAIRKARGLKEYDRSEFNSLKPKLEEMLFKERARENAYEGRRWYDLLLMETRLGYTGIIAERVSKKYSDPAKAEAVKAQLGNPDSWYLPIDPDKWK